MSQDRGNRGGNDDATDDVTDSASAAAPAGKRSRRGGSVSPTTKSQRRAAANEAKTVATVPVELALESDSADEKQSKGNRNPFVALYRFFAQVVGELRKVIWPTRPQMVIYTIVVLAFLVFLTALVSGVDLGAGKLVELVFDVR